MEKITLTLNNKDGLHARPAAVFVQEANKYDSEIEIEFQGLKVNGKSIIGIMSLGAFYGEDITIIARGKDEEDAVKALEELIVNDFEKL
ncbi:MAG TPA: HPr family phosphocarrier protein [Tissierellaceae bacterium]|nr:HPr family phosphocarrier protein [Tissierellaceae bacterium]